MELRWTERNGEKVLQYRQFLGSSNMIYTDWSNVPTEKDEKTERQQVCDEIIEAIKGLGFYCISPYEVERIIKQIRDK